MAKAKTESLPNRHMYTRVSYLHQAACYLSTVQPTTSNSKPTSQEEPHDNAQSDRGKHSASETVARRLVSDIRAVSLKAQIRPSPAVKQMMCKYCDSLLVEGKTCSTTVENLSKGGKKPWADVMVTKCKTCGNVKRFPVNAARQKRRPFREPKDVEMTQPTFAVFGLESLPHRRALRAVGTLEEALLRAHQSDTPFRVADPSLMRGLLPENYE